MHRESRPRFAPPFASVERGGHPDSNLWFAAKEQNWPLADFYRAEPRSHLRWAVRIIPVRKTPQGQELKLADLLDPMDKSVLKELQAAIAAQDSEAFRAK